MDLLKTILVYMSMVVVASVQNAPDPGSVPAYDEPTPTPYVQAAPTPTSTPTATPKPTPVPTIDITPNPEYGTLQVGDKGDEVRRLQEELARYGYYEGDIDGVYGNQTRRAVEEFQYQHGLSADGMAGRITLTVLYESGQVRLSPSAATPAPSATSSLSVALTEMPATVTPAATETPAPAATEPPAATVSATPAATPTATPTATTATPTVTATPSATPAPAFEAMEGYGIRLDGSQEALTIAQEDEEAALLPYRMGEEVYLPLIEILHAAQVNVISSQSVEADEYAFAVNDDIIRIAFTHDQAGAPVSLEVYKNNEPQIVPVRDIRSVSDVLYLPTSTIESLTGIAAQTDEAAQTVTVTLPAAPEEAE